RGAASLPARASGADRHREPRPRACTGPSGLGMGGLIEMSPPYDEALFRELVEAWKRGKIVQAPPPGTLEPLRPGDVVPLPPRGTAERSRLAALGDRLLRGGAGAALVVAGGGGTRFGGAQKALVPAVAGRTFVALRLLVGERASETVGRAGPAA